MKLLVLAGGVGSRLRSAVADRPKALAPAAGKPFLALQMMQWRQQGVRDFVFLLHHQADQIIAFLEKAKREMTDACAVNWLIEPTPLDTGGAVAHAVRELNLDANFLVTNADTWLGTGVREVAKSNAPALGVVRRHDTGRYGQVRFNDRGQVTAFAEKSAEGGGGWINAGLCQLSPELFADWDGKPLSIERAMYPNWVAEGTLRAVPLVTEFIDIGIPEDYYRFCRWAEAGARGPLCN